MGTSNILGGLLMGLGQSRAQINREEFEREQASLEQMRGLIIGLMDKVPPDMQQQLAALSMESFQGKMNSKKVWERLQPLILGTKPTPVPGTGGQVPPRTIGGGPGPQLKQITPPPAAMGGGPVVAGAAGMPLPPPPPPSTLPELGLAPELSAMPEMTIPGFTMQPVMEEMGPFAQRAAMDREAKLEDLRATERIKAEFNPQLRFEGTAQGVIDRTTGEVVTPATPKDPDLSFEEQAFSDMEDVFIAENRRKPSAAERLAMRAKVRELLQGDAMKEYRQALLEMQKNAQDAQRLQQQFSREDRLRSDYEALVKDDAKRAAGYADLVQAISGGAGDIQILYQFIKMQDPNAVREGEIALAERARGSLPEWLVGLWDWVYEGNVLHPATKVQLVEQAKELYQGSILPRIRAANERYTQRAKAVNVPPAAVVRPIEDFTIGTIPTLREPKSFEPD